jgi:hypothetical protein
MHLHKIAALMVATLAWTLVHTGAKGQDAGAAKPDKPFAIKELEKKVFHISFAAGKKAELKIESENETDVDLFVEEMDGKEVVEDTEPSPNCQVEFTPLKAKTYRISIINLGPGENKCKFTHNGKVEQPDFGKTTQTKPLKIAEDGTQTIDVKLAEGKWAAVWVFGKSKSDVDVFVFDPDGNEIAADEHISKDAFVSFLPKASGAYRIEVRNLGPGENECTVKHTTAADAKRENR